MGPVKATWKNGQVQLDRPVDWPEDRRLVVAADSMEDIDFMTEEEQSDDPEAIERWIAELDALPGITMTPEEEAEMIAWRKKEKEFNLEAARREMEKEIP